MSNNKLVSKSIIATMIDAVITCFGAMLKTECILSTQEPLSSGFFNKIFHKP